LVNSTDILNLPAAMAQIEGNSELLRELAVMFLDQYPKLLAEIHDGLSASDLEVVSSAAHTLGSSAGQIGAGRALTSARKLEEVAGKREELSSVAAALARLEAELAVVHSALVEQVDCSPIQNEELISQSQKKRLSTIKRLAH
jgi:HPt (histidine-containing phosphotransfer) domain-containing protein